MELHQQLTLGSGTTLDCPTDYRTLVGDSQYLELTRPDIAFATNRLAQFMKRPTTAHWQALKRLLRYLKGTLDCGLTLHANSSLNLHAFSDADWLETKMISSPQVRILSTSAAIPSLGALRSNAQWLVSPHRMNIGPSLKLPLKLH